MTDLSRALASFPSLGALAPHDRAQLASRSSLRSLSAGTVYLREGDSCAGVALVTSGRIRVSRSSPTGREITLYHIGPGETCILSASCVMRSSSYPALATVTEDVTALVVPGDLFRHLVATSEPLRSFILAHFGERLATVMALVEEVAFAAVDRRLAHWLATEFQRIPAPLTLSHDEIAAHLGTARVVVSRVLETFQDRGWLSLGRRRIDVRDPVALASYGNQSD